jgi:uncharacterized protein (DUF433 family)
MRVLWSAQTYSIQCARRYSRRGGVWANERYALGTICATKCSDRPLMHQEIAFKMFAYPQTNEHYEIDHTNYGSIRPRSAMNPVKEAEELLSGMSRAQKAEFLQSIVRDLGDAFPGIESVPDVMGGVPCIARTRIPIWLLEQARRLGTRESELLRNYPLLTAQDLVNAWSFVRSHRAEIEQQIAENERDED